MADGKIGLPGLLAALENGDERVARTARRWRRFIAVAVTVSCLLTVAYLGWTLFALRDAWHTGQWRYFWGQLNGIWPLVALGARFWAVDDPFTGYVDVVRKMQEAAIKGDEQDAPIAQEYSQLSQDSSMLFGGISYGPLKRPHDGRSIGPIVLVVMGLLMAITFGAVLLAVGMSAASDGARQVNEIIWGITLILLLLSIWPLVVVLRMRRGILVTADDMGVAWKQAGWRTRRRSIAWHDTRAFFVITQRKSTNWTKETTWVLMGSAGALAWMAPREEAAQTDTPHARFAALVASRTRLPLRDLSALADRMTNRTLIAEQRKAAIENATRIYEETKREILAARTQPEKAAAWLSTQRREQAADAVLSAHRSEQTTKKSGLGWGCTVQLVLLVVIGLMYAGGWGLEQYQPHYYEGMLAQIHASKPLYHDDLSHDDGDWPLCAPTADRPNRCSYGGQAYHLTSASGRFISAWTEPVYGNAVVEGTVRQIGTVEYDGVGLILRAFDDNTDMLVFFIHPTDGTWSLAHYHDVGGSPDDNWTAFENGSSSAIRTGQGAANDLLVVITDDRYTCYINGKVVLMYDDSEHAIPRMGHVGLYVNDGAVEGVFTDFTVYPAPAPSVWSAL